MNEQSQAGKSPACSGDATVFEAYLEQTGKAFLLTDDSNEQCAHVRFTGTFEEKPVVWDCEFVTLVSQFNKKNGRTGEEAMLALRCFIEIGAPALYGVPIRIGLHVPRIDAAEIRKMIIMVRNYKRLRRGRYEFGESYQP